MSVIERSGARCDLLLLAEGSGAAVVAQALSPQVPPDVGHGGSGWGVTRAGDVPIPGRDQLCSLPMKAF